ncbi:TPA: hypothetical protein DF272_01880 [Candidatus Falkowbacteria bacterium]|nr:hypothetical protein [Candidatus Falkowbacteria bacterium]
MSGKARYQLVADGELKADTLEVSELFDLGSQAAVAGHPEIKNRIYELIAKHPQAGEADLARVMINKADWARRHGQPVEAIALLELMPPVDQQTHIEWLQAMGECHLAIFDEHRQAALALAREAYEQSQ